MKIGYVRVSTKEQQMDLQIDALNSFGCDKIYKEVASGAKAKRIELNKLLDTIRSGDVLVIYKLDRLGRSLKHLVELVDILNEKKVGLVSLNDPIDTTTPQGRLVFNIFSSLAEFERELIRERTKAGLASARARGKKGGRPKGLSKEAQAKAKMAESLYKSKEYTIKEICNNLSISANTLYSYLRFRGVFVK